MIGSSSGRHVLHEALDALIDEYLRAHPGKSAAETSLRQVLEWHCQRQQTQRRSN